MAKGEVHKRSVKVRNALKKQGAYVQFLREGDMHIPTRTVTVKEKGKKTKTSKRTDYRTLKLWVDEEVNQFKKQNRDPIA